GPAGEVPAMRRAVRGRAVPESRVGGRQHAVAGAAAGAVLPAGCHPGDLPAPRPGLRRQDLHHHLPSMRPRALSGAPARRGDRGGGIIVKTTTAAKTAGPPAGAKPRDWLKLLERARLLGYTLEAPRRECGRLLRNRANAASMRAETLVGSG